MEWITAASMYQKMSELPQLDTRAVQKAVYQNKVAHHFNVTDVDLEFLLLYGEVGEAVEAYHKKSREELAAELADVAIYLLGMAEILEIDLGAAVNKKMAYNRICKDHEN